MHGWWVSECYSVLIINLYVLSVHSTDARIGAWFAERAQIFASKQANGTIQLEAISSPIHLHGAQGQLYLLFYVTLFYTAWCHDPEDHNMSKLKLFVHP